MGVCADEKKSVSHRRRFAQKSEGGLREPGGRGGARGEEKLSTLQKGGGSAEQTGGCLRPTTQRPQKRLKRKQYQTRNLKIGGGKRPGSQQGHGPTDLENQ